MHFKSTLQKLRKGFQVSFLMLLLFSFFGGKINAQTYVNSNLSTGATTSTGAVAPTGFTWSELQLTNTTLGNGASIAAGLTIADDFTVPAGPFPWNLTKATFYAYSTGYTGTTSPFTDVRVQIYNTDPSVGSPTPIYGDLTTNRLAQSTSALVYRTAAAGNTQRQVWKIEANVSTTLAPGTYWIEYQVGTSLTSNFCPTGTVVGTITQAGNNAYQRTIATNSWVPLNDGGSLARQDMPFTLDYTTGACSGTPNPGHTLASSPSICPGLSVILSLQNATGGSGVTYQWQSSASLAGPYTDITGATSATYSSAQTVPTYYQAVVTCSGNSGTSVPVFVNMTPNSGCYCAAGSTDVDPTFEKISNVTFGALNNSSTSAAGYENFSSVAAPSFEAGVTAPIVITGSNTYGGDRVRVWIDFNQNGNFNDAGELVYASALGAGPYNGNVTFPVNAVAGSTKMRIRLYDDVFGNGNNTACGDNTYGQVEDYVINITPCIPGTISAQPVSATINCGSSKTFSVTAAGTALTYQWQERANATSPWVIVANGGIYSGATTSTLTIAAVPGTSNGHQFQVAIGGPCTPVFLSSIATLTVNPLVATVNTPLPVNRCAGDAPTQISVTNASGATTTTSFPSGPLALAIPETNQDGVNNIINVTTVPSGVNVVGLSVRLNITHTWAGDLVAVLKAPNGQIINLVALLDGSGGTGATAGFTNTVISSTGVTPLNAAATQPFTGTFAANLALNPILGLGAGYYDPMPVGPTGFLPTTANWNNLYSTANGDWTLAIFDGYDDSGAPGQPVNTLNNWSINITYGTPATGVFSPNTGLSEDAAGTIPYTGTAINTVYASPAASTDYSLVVTTPSCVSTALTIPVIVNNPITGGSTVPTTFAGCVGGSTTITSSTPTSGNNIAHQWKVSTDNGVTYTNVNNGGSYSGANTATLTISGITTALDGNLYKDSLFVTSCNSNTVTNASELTVNPVPTVTITAAPANTQFYPGLTTTLTAASSTSASVYKWYKNGVLIPGANGSTLFVDVDGAGDYTVTITDANGCSGTSSAITITTVSNDVLFIYPSPNSGQFQVRYYNTNGNTTNIRTLSVYDSKGARVYSKSYDINQPYTRMDVDMRNYSKGVYRVELGDRNGKRLKTGSVLIQ